MSEHILSSKTLRRHLALLLLADRDHGGVAFIDLGPFNTVVALVIASVKALLVILFFMHVKYTSEKLTKVVVVSAIFWLIILLALSLADYTTRLLA